MTTPNQPRNGRSSAGTGRGPSAADASEPDGGGRPAPQMPAHQGPRPAARPRPPQQSTQPPPWQRDGAPAGPPQGPPPRPDTQRPTPPQQRPPEQQRAPQTNLQQRPAGPGQAPYAPAGGVDEQTRAARKEESRGKAAVIDGPTRNIARNDLPTDMPDLSSVSHPGPEASTGSVATAVAAPAGDGSPLRAMVQLRRIDPWSTLKLSLVISVSLFFVWMVAVGLLYLVLDGMGVWDRLNNAFTDIVANSGDSGLVSAGQIFGYSAVIGLINVVLFTALTTIGSFIYNLCSDLVGGLEITLADRD